MSTARGNLRLVVPFPTVKLPSYRGMLSEDKLLPQFPIKQIHATNSITTIRRTNYSSRTTSPLAHFCPIIVCLFVQWAGWKREGAKYESLHILVAILILSSWSPLVLFQRFRLYRLHYLGCNPTQSDSYPTLVATRHVFVPR